MDRRIEAAIETIHKEMQRNVPVHELAQQVRLSTGHFIRLFKTETSLSPKQYVRYLRMRHAEALLNGSSSASRRLLPALALATEVTSAATSRKYTATLRRTSETASGLLQMTMNNSRH
jgi:transcriptional regulator GlxA family with amidase domain